MSTLELVQYYANLLILQYVGQPKAYAMVQTVVTPVVMPQSSIETISFSAVAASGSFVLNYDGNLSAAINWDDSTATIQTKIQAIPGLSAATVVGTIGSELLTVSFNFATLSTPAFLFTVQSNSVEDSSGNPIAITVTETDVTLPLAVQNAYNLIGPNPAQGIQLDVLGKYAGVTRSGYGLTGEPITLDDADFLTFIQFAIIRNSLGSSLNSIQQLVFQFFGTNMLVFDYQNMQMSFLINDTVGSFDLIQLLITEGLLPKPMAVGATVIYYPVLTEFFSFRTYDAPVLIGEPFNDYDTYVLTWPWLSYSDAYVL